jgi:hypothetical protein
MIDREHTINIFQILLLKHHGRPQEHGNHLLFRIGKREELSKRRQISIVNSLLFFMIIDFLGSKSSWSMIREVYISVETVFTKLTYANDTRSLQT